MTRHMSLLVVAALLLTACTDQPLPAEPSTTPTATATISPTASATPPPSHDRLARMVTSILEHEDPDVLATGAEISQPLNAVLGVSPEHEPTATQDPDESPEPQCSPLPTSDAEVAVYGEILAAEPPHEDDPAEATPPERRGLGAWRFTSGQDALAFTAQLRDTVENCYQAQAEVTVLTHHTDEAHQIKRPAGTDQLAQLVVVRDDQWVMLHFATPPTDVALSLTVIDQLTEMLR